MNQTIIPGTFELEEEQVAAIKYSIQLGPTIQKLFPQIADNYRSGKSLNDLVEECKIRVLFPMSERTAQEAVRLALRGYHREINLFPDFDYNGLLNLEEYEMLAKNHHRESGRRLGEEIGYKSGQKTFEAGTGVHKLEYIERHYGGQKGIVKQGNIPWSDEEILTIEELSRDTLYQRRSEIHAQRIANEINNRFHYGRPVRNNRSVVKAYSRYKNRFDEFKRKE